MSLKKNKQLIRSDFSKNVLTLISGTTIAQLISIGITPILSRIYSTDDFGVFAAYTAIGGLMTLVVGARYEGAILLPKKDEDAANLLVLTLFLNFIISGLFFFGIVCYDFFVPKGGGNSMLYQWLYVLPVFTFFSGVAQSLNNWFNRKKKYQKIVYYRVTNAVTNSGGALFFGYIHFPLNGLIISIISSSIVSISVFFIEIKSDFQQFKNSINKERMKSLAKEYKRFPLTNSVQSISDALQIYGIVYFIDKFFGNPLLGIYSMSSRILQVPMNFIGGAMAQVFYQQASETYIAKGDMKALIRSTMLKSALLALPVLIVLVLLGPWLFSAILGEKWYDAGVYAQILAPWMLLDFIRAPLSQVPIIVGKQNRLLLISIISNVIVFASMFYAGFVLKDMIIGLYLLSFFQSIFIIGIIIWIYSISTKND